MRARPSERASERPRDRENCTHTHTHMFFTPNPPHSHFLRLLFPTNFCWFYKFLMVIAVVLLRLEREIVAERETHGVCGGVQSERESDRNSQTQRETERETQRNEHTYKQRASKSVSQTSTLALSLSHTHTNTLTNTIPDLKFCSLLRDTCLCFCSVLIFWGAKVVSETCSFVKLLWGGYD